MKAWEVTRKDLRLLRRDKRTLVLLVVLPMIFITIIGMTTGKLIGFDEPNRVLRIAIVDAIDYSKIDGGAAGDSKYGADRTIARNLFVKLFNYLQDLDGLSLREYPTVEEGRTAFQNGETNVALIVGPYFYEDVQRLTEDNLYNSEQGGVQLRFEQASYREDEKPKLTQRLAAFLELSEQQLDLQSDELFPGRLLAVLPRREGTRLLEIWRSEPQKLRDVAAPLKLETVFPDGLALRLGSLDISLQSDAPGSASHSIVDQLAWVGALSTISKVPLCKSTYVERRIRTECAEMRDAAQNPPLATNPPRQKKESGSRVYQELIPSYTVLFVFFLVNIMARSFIQERSIGTLRRLRIAPITPTSLLTGKTLPFLMVSLVQTIVLFLFGRLVWGMSWGPAPWLLLPVIFSCSVAATALGLLIATLVETDSQVSAYANFVVIVTGGISGCFMPRDWLPDLMQDISLITPHAWALIAYDQILSIRENPDAAVVAQCCGMLLLFGAIFFTAGALRFRRTE